MVDLGTRIKSLRTVWILVDADGSSRVAVPFEREDPGGGQWGQGLPIEQTLHQVALTFGTSRGWDVMVSVLLGGDAAERTRRCLPPGGRELDSEEYAVLAELGMEVPFGIWASPDSASIFLIPGEE